MGVFTFLFLRPMPLIPLIGIVGYYYLLLLVFLLFGRNSIPLFSVCRSIEVKSLLWFEDKEKRKKDGRRII